MMVISKMTFAKDYIKRSLSEIAVLYIKNQILSGVFKSGDKLIETELSNDLGISRAPLREAIRQLNVEGLLVFSPRKGNHVLDMTLEETMEVFEIRTALEKQIMEILVKQQLLTDADISHLLLLVEQMLSQENEDLSPTEMLYRLNSLDLQFHSYLWNASKSFRRAEILEKLFYQLLIVMNHNTVTLGAFRDKAQEHTRIIEAFRKNDLDLVHAEFQAHISVYIDAVTKGLSK